MAKKSAKDIIAAAKGDGPTKKPKAAAKERSSGASPTSQSGLSKGVDKDSIDLDSMFEARDGKLNIDIEEELGYGIPLYILDERQKGAGKSSDPVHPDIPRPVADKKTTIVTCSPETKKGIIDRWGTVPEYVDILNVGKFWQAAKPETAKEAAAAVEKFFDQAIEGDGLCNVVIDDLERFHEKLFVDVARAEMGYKAGEFPFDDKTKSFYLRRKVLDDLILDKAKAATKHLLWVNGYAGEWKTEEREVGGQTRPVRVYEPRRWVGYFEKPFDVILVGGMDTNISEEGEETEDDVWTIRVRSSKVNRLFPQGTRMDVTGPGVAKFWQVFREKNEGTSDNKD